MVLGVNAADYSKWGSDIYKIKYMDLPNFEKVNNGVYVIDLGGISLDILLQGFSESKNAYCLVVFSGALSKKGIPPFFSGVTLAREVGVPLISISDPSLSLSEDLMLAWYAGNQLELNLPSKIAKILDNIFQKLEVKPILMGGSGGGFASLLQTSLLETPVKTIVWNPQTNISKYHINHVFKYLKICFPNFKDEIISYEKMDVLNQNIKLLELVHKIGLINDVYDIKKKDVLFLQNIKDNYHIKNHLYPFFKSEKGFKRNGVNSFVNSHDLALHIGAWGEGHIPPYKEIIVNTLKSIIKGKSNKDISSTLSMSYSNKSYIPNFSIEKSKINYKLIEIMGEKFVEIYLDEDWEVLNLEYAAYFIKDNVNLKIDWYQFSTRFLIPDSDFDSIHIFVRDIFGNVLQEIIPVDFSVNIA
ncbi:hypothetical protein FPL18_06380 [Acinetobacter gyllenbergii]|uniref:hypothetical protein n=1 Tax=Acinetobacter proteolyticus TaxID=1776741 RepID=UPI00132ED3D3|nr:hypothetical protein FPL18_06380 [Acinetobacter gyllenbergii]